MTEWARDVPGGCALTVRVTPRAARPGIQASPEDVLVRVKAPPADGRATAEAAARLAEALGVPKTAVRLLRGASSRAKTFGIAGLTAEAAVSGLLRT